MNQDIICGVCGEPYEIFYLVDEEPEWKDKMLRGEGCPSCKGEKPQGLSEKTNEELDFERLNSIEENTDLDSVDFMVDFIHSRSD